MRSIEGGALRRVAEAIDRLEADRQDPDATDLEARIAAVWSMVSEIDPELARLASGYTKPEQRGMDVTVVTTATTDEEGRSLLRRLGFPFRES
jgi:hypothetical protein